MQDFQKRVIEEKNELDSRIEKLGAFGLSETFAKLPGDEQGRMIRQLAMMEGYSEALGQRIAAF